MVCVCVCVWGGGGGGWVAVGCFVSLLPMTLPGPNTGSLCEEPGGTGKQSVVGRSVWVLTHLHGAAAQAVS